MQRSSGKADIGPRTNAEICFVYPGLMSNENHNTMHEIPVGLEQKALISVEVVLLLLLEFAKLQMFCSFQMENGLVI